MSRLILILLLLAFILLGITYMAYRFFREEQKTEHQKELMREKRREKREERDWEALMEDIEDDEFE